MTTYTVIKHHPSGCSDLVTESAQEAFAFYCRGTVQWVSHVVIGADDAKITPEELEQAALIERRGADRIPL